MAEVKASEQPYVLRLWFGVNKGMLPVKYTPTKPLCVSQISFRSQCCHKDEVNLTTLRFGDITGCKAVCLSVCLSVCVDMKEVFDREDGSLVYILWV